MTTSPRLYQGGNPVNGVAPYMVPRTSADNPHYDRWVESVDKEFNIKVAAFNSQVALQRSDPEAYARFDRDCRGSKDQLFWRWKSLYLVHKVAVEAKATLRRQKGIKIDAEDMDKALIWLSEGINGHAKYLKALYRQRVECRYATSKEEASAWSEAEDRFRMAMAKPVRDYWLIMKEPDAIRTSSTGISTLAGESVTAVTANSDISRPRKAYNVIPPPFIPRARLSNAVSGPSMSNTSEIAKAAEPPVLMRSRKRPTLERPKPTSEAGQESPPPKRVRHKTKGGDRDDKETKGAMQFGYRLYNYFNHRSGDKKPQELVDAGVFADGEQILRDGAPCDAGREKNTIEGLTKPGKISTTLATAEKRAIYRIAKSQTAIAAVIYYEHNLRRQQRREASGQSILNKRDLLNFNTTAVQYVLNRDATVFGAIFKLWSSWQYIPAMFPDPPANSMPTGMTEAMDKYGKEIRKRIYNEYVEWEKSRTDLSESERILIEELPTEESESEL